MITLINAVGYGKPETIIETKNYKVMEKEEAWHDVPPSFQEMLPVARRMVKQQIKNELVDYLKQKKGLDLEKNAPDK